ncbi:two-component sensor histidine kinase [Devosia pacifica]|uniref:histidine kinase n=1 Tax=Devosia pacifica TaxID=1335967 RepID=A0A918VW95_9HYPH|nr:ATP-binding protein [Devosia pacifica]GHA29158.1 two-component sensor histidine kinase [Devosia pacifica]
MRSLPQLLRTTSVRLTATFILIFVVFSVLLLGIIAWQASIQIQRQQTADIDREVRLLQRIDRTQGLRGIAVAVQRLANQPGPGIYYLGDRAGLFLLGNITDVPDQIIFEPGVYSFDYERPRPFDPDEEGEAERTQGFAVVRSVELASGLRLIVGRDVVERRGFTAIIIQAFLFGVAGILIFSLVAGGLTARRILRRIDTIGATSAKIMSGNLSERVPVTPRNDEFDGLATNLNAMLDRIEQLLQGLKEVTDNVAHDLKTPLTRLRNQAESALRPTADDEQRRQALEATIAESEKLIRTFNALLMIARAEAGAPSGAFAEVDISAVVADVADLYTPLAEDSGMSLVTRIEPDVTLRSNRELLGQAVVNLIDNAIKYLASEEPREGRIEVGVERGVAGVRIVVSDNGPGIQEEDRQRVLQRFVRLEKSRTEPGSGLGLALVDATARLHGGTFRLEDNAPGVRAIIELPAR